MKIANSTKYKCIAVASAIAGGLLVLGAQRACTAVTKRFKKPSPSIIPMPGTPVKAVKAGNASEYTIDGLVISEF